MLFLLIATSPHPAASLDTYRRTAGCEGRFSQLAADGGVKPVARTPCFRTEFICRSAGLVSRSSEVCTQISDDLVKDANGDASVSSKTIGVFGI